MKRTEEGDPSERRDKQQQLMIIYMTRRAVSLTNDVMRGRKRKKKTSGRGIRVKGGGGHSLLQERKDCSTLLPNNSRTSSEPTLTSSFSLASGENRIKGKGQKRGKFAKEGFVRGGGVNSLC